MTDTDLSKYVETDPDDAEDQSIPFVEQAPFGIAIGIVILINAIFIGAETELGSESSDYRDRIGWYIVENIFCVIFLLEAGVRFYYLRCRYFQDAWNLLDFFLVSLAVADTWVLTSMGASGQLRVMSSLRVIRMLRLVRLIRLLRMFKELYLIVNGLIESMRTLVWVVVLLLIFLYIMAIFTTMQIGQDHDSFRYYLEESGTDWDYLDYFGDVPKSMYTLFQVLTLESWADAVARHVVRKNALFAPFFIFFLMITTFGLLNLVVGVIVENTLTAARNNEEKIRKRQEVERKRVLEHLKDIFEVADKDGSGEVTTAEFKKSLQNRGVQEKLKMIDLPVQEAEELFLVLDHDGSGSLNVDEFIGGVMRLKGSAKSKDMLAVQISLESLGKRMDVLETGVEGTEKATNALEARCQQATEQSKMLLRLLESAARRH